MLGGPIGVDVGLHHLVALSDGTIYENIKPLRTVERKIARLNRELSRRKNGGQNWRKTELKLNAAHAKARNIRQHILHDISRDIVARKPSAIVLEDLNVQGMMQNRHLARAIADVGWYELRRQIEYKAAWAGTKVILADRWFPSSRTCSECGHVRDDLTLAEREYVCPACGAILDRDVNAARNLAALALLQPA